MLEVGHAKVGLDDNDHCWQKGVDGFPVYGNADKPLWVKADDPIEPQRSLSHDQLCNSAMQNANCFFFIGCHDTLPGGGGGPIPWDAVMRMLMALSVLHEAQCRRFIFLTSICNGAWVKQNEARSVENGKWTSIYCF